MTHSALTDGFQITSDSSSRDGWRPDHFILHHAATTSLAAILSLFQPGGRTVSANYALGNDGTLICTVDEDRRPWTSSSAHWDGRSITIEVANNSTAGWTVSDATFDKLARLIADVAIRYNFPIDNDHVITHQELYQRFGASYPTACPGDMQRRKGELLNLANFYRNPPAPVPPAPKEDPQMRVIKQSMTGEFALVGVRFFQSAGPAADPGAIATANAWAEVWGDARVVTPEAYNEAFRVATL